MWSATLQQTEWIRPLAKRQLQQGFTDSQHRYALVNLPLMKCLLARDSCHHFGGKIEVICEVAWSLLRRIHAVMEMRNDRYAFLGIAAFEDFRCGTGRKRNVPSIGESPIRKSLFQFPKTRKVPLINGRLVHYAVRT